MPLRPPPPIIDAGNRQGYMYACVYIYIYMIVHENTCTSYTVVSLLLDKSVHDWRKKDVTMREERQCNKKKKRPNNYELLMFSNKTNTLLTVLSHSFNVAHWANLCSVHTICARAITLPILHCLRWNLSRINETLYRKPQAKWQLWQPASLEQYRARN